MDQVTSVSSKKGGVYSLSPTQTLNFRIMLRPEVELFDFTGTHVSVGDHLIFSPYKGDGRLYIGKVVKVTKFRVKIQYMWCVRNTRNQIERVEPMSYYRYIKQTDLPIKALKIQLNSQTDDRERVFGKNEDPRRSV